MRKSINLNRLSVAILVFATTPVAGGQGGSGGGGKAGGGTGVTPANAVEVRTLSERIPAGGTVQVKALLTQPRPIGAGGSGFATNGFDVNGVSLFSPLGDAAGAAVWQNDLLTVSVISPDADYGTSLDYPFMTVTMTIPSATPAGSTYDLGLLDAAYQSPAGPLALTDPKPGTLTIGGSVSIHNIVPGGGTWPAGTVVKVQGTGFSPLSQLAAKMHISTAIYDSPAELRFTLLDSSTVMDMQPITVTNPDGSRDTYNSYLRGIAIQSPSRSLLTHTDPVFQAQTRGLATVIMPSLPTGQFVGLAVQNPTQGQVAVTLHAKNAATTFQLPSGGRIMDELSALLGGAALTENDLVTITATAGVQILGLLADDNAGTVKPFLPLF